MSRYVTATFVLLSNTLAAQTDHVAIEIRTFQLLLLSSTLTLLTEPYRNCPGFDGATLRLYSGLMSSVFDTSGVQMSSSYHTVTFIWKDMLIALNNLAHARRDITSAWGLVFWLLHVRDARILYFATYKHFDRLRSRHLQMAST